MTLESRLFSVTVGPCGAWTSSSSSELKRPSSELDDSAPGFSKAWSAWNKFSKSIFRISLVNFFLLEIAWGLWEPQLNNKMQIKAQKSWISEKKLNCLTEYVNKVSSILLASPSPEKLQNKYVITIYKSIMRESCRNNKIWSNSRSINLRETIETYIFSKRFGPLFFL